MAIRVAPLLPIPPIALISRVTGKEDLEWFNHSGGLSVGDWTRALGAVGIAFKDFGRIVDFGCGCGRVLRHLRPSLQPHQELIGLDVDGEAIDWLRQNYPTIKSFKLDLLPPAPIEDSSVGLIVNHSVFTHLPEDVQFAWLKDLHRILRPGGTALLTIHGRKVWDDYYRNQSAIGRKEELDVLTRRFNRRGFYYAGGRNAFEAALPDYYGSAFHTIAYVEAEWSRYFKLRAWLPVAALAHQDILVLEKI